MDVLVYQYPMSRLPVASGGRDFLLRFFQFGYIVGQNADD